MADDFEAWLNGRPAEADVDDGRLSPGTVIGEYRVEALLGRGGFAEVYRAVGRFADGDGRAVAIKLLHRLDEKSRLRFEREARILAQVHHRNLPRFLGFGTCAGRPYIVTELLQSCELPKRDRAVARFLDAILSAVGELHRRGFVHRDIKPSNILCRANGEPVLIDFGLAVPMSEALREQSALSVDGENKVAVGTLGFSAPEQFAGQVSGAASDIHAVGALIDACFDGKMPRRWKRIYLTATNSNPKVRYQSVCGMRRAVALRHLWRALRIGAALAVVALAAAALMFYEEASDYRADSQADSAFGILYAPPIDVELPVMIDDEPATVACRISYKVKAKGEGEGEGVGTRAKDVGEMLNEWLVEYLLTEYEGYDLETLCDEFSDEDFANRFDSGFWDYVKEKNEELPPAARIEFSEVKVSLVAIGDFADEKFSRKIF